MPRFQASVCERPVAIFDRYIPLIGAIDDIIPVRQIATDRVRLPLPHMAATVPLEVTVELTLRDIYRANVSIALGSRTRWGWLIYILVQIAWASLLFFALFSLFSGERAAWFVLLWGPLFFLLFMPFIWFVLPYTNARSLVRGKPDVSKPVHWKFFPDRIEARAPASETTLQWSAFLKIRETDEQYLIYFQKQLANVLPKRCFRNASDVDEFRKLVRVSFKGETILRD